MSNLVGQEPGFDNQRLFMRWPVSSEETVAPLASRPIVDCEAKRVLESTSLQRTLFSKLVNDEAAIVDGTHTAGQSTPRCVVDVVETNPFALEQVVEDGGEIVRLRVGSPVPGEMA